MESFILLFLDKRGELSELFIQHMNMTAIAVFISLMIGVPLGIIVTKHKRLADFVIGFANVLQSIPSIALLAFAVPFVGIGERPAILMVIVYSLLPILKNTYTGIKGIDPKMLEVARGLGMSPCQRLFKIELPLTASYIMAGIRISAVAAVGTMTIAAFAGAGGLGWFINLGLNSQNVNLVLLGAIPASCLALFFDYILGKLEKVVTPEGLLPASQIKNIDKKKRRMQRFSVVSVCMLLVFVPLGSSAYDYYLESQQKKLVIGSNNFTEAIILGYLLQVMVENNTDIKVEGSYNLGGAIMELTAMNADELDAFACYTGTILPNFLHEKMDSHDPAAVYEQSKKGLDERFGIKTSQNIGFNNTYVMAVTPEIARKYNLKTVKDLMRVADKLRLGCTVEFVHRDDCLPSLEKLYNNSFAEVRGLDGSIRYSAIASGEVDVIDAFSIDALLFKNDLVLLEDRDNFFPPYDAVYLIRGEALEEYPEIVPLIKRMEGLIDEKTMGKMNMQVDIDGMDAREVAEEFLRGKGMIE